MYSSCVWECLEKQTNKKQNISAFVAGCVSHDDNPPSKLVPPQK